MVKPLILPFYFLNQIIGLGQWIISNFYCIIEGKQFNSCLILKEIYARRLALAPSKSLAPSMFISLFIWSSCS